jgi:hypothetical protein
MAVRNTEKGEAVKTDIVGTTGSDKVEVRFTCGDRWGDFWVITYVPPFDHAWI